MAVVELSLGEALERARARTGLTQQRLGELFRGAAGDSGVSNNTVESWLRGRTEPKISQYNVLAHIINEHFDRLGLSDRLPFVQVAVDDKDAPAETGASVVTFQLPDGSFYQMSYFAPGPFLFGQGRAAKLSVHLRRVTNHAEPVRRMRPSEAA